MIDRSIEKYECEYAVRIAIETLPRITRAVINAGMTSKPVSWRKAQLAEAIAQTRFLLGDLELRQARLGWEERRGDVA